MNNFNSFPYEWGRQENGNSYTDYQKADASEGQFF